MPLSDRLEQLQTALLYCTMGRSLRTAAYWSLGWGAIILALGLLISSRGRLDYIDIGFGVALVVEGMYLISTRNPIAMVVEGATLAGLVLFDIVTLVVAFRAGAKSGPNPIGILVLAFGAWNMFSSYRTYKLVCEKADPSAIEICRQQLDRIASGNSDNTVTMAWDKNLESKDTWVACFADDLILFVNGPKKAFRNKVDISSGVWLPRQDIRVENAGDAWVGKKVKARLYNKEAEFLKVKLAKSDFDRFQDLLLGRAAIAASSEPLLSR